MPPSRSRKESIRGYLASAILVSVHLDLEVRIHCGRPLGPFFMWHHVVEVEHHG